MEHQARIRVRETIRPEGQSHATYFTGRVDRVEVTHGFAITDGRGDRLFFHKTDVGDAAWGMLDAGTRIGFAIGFSFSGPQAREIEVI